MYNIYEHLCFFLKNKVILMIIMSDFILYYTYLYIL